MIRFYLILPVLLFAIVAHGQTSVLSSGGWFHFSTQNDGVHWLSYEDLEQLGIISAPVQSDLIRLFSNGPGMLPEENWLPRPEDLLEVAITVSDGADGLFGPEDYFLFYGTDQILWKFDFEEARFYHQNHLYDDKTHFFLTLDSGTGLRITEMVQDTTPAAFETSSFTDRQVHEEELFNIHHSGKKWYGEGFENSTEHSFTFHFPNIIQSQTAHCIVDLVSRSYGTGNTNNFELSAVGSSLSFEVENISGNYLNDLVRPAQETLSFSPEDEEIEISLQYEPYDLYSAAWINYIMVQAERELRASAATQLLFRQPQDTDTGSTTYTLEDYEPEFSIWDITDFHHPQKITGQQNGNIFEFTAPNDQLREFVCFSNTNLFTPEFEGLVPNQDLKSQAPAEAFIVTHPDFLAQAEALAAFHTAQNGLTVNVATTVQIFREFSGGAKDVTAIKDYLRHFYNQSENTGVTPRYLCLFGDASFDYKGHLFPGSDFVPTYESDNSYAIINSYCSDDYFGLLDFSDSNESLDAIDIGIGRLPARSVEEAQTLVDKIIAYHQPENTGEWQYNVAFIADDEDNNLHMTQANLLANNLEGNHCPLHLHKIYLDAFEQVALPEGDRYPEATEAILNRLSSGVLVCNYTGHSGFSNWSGEQVLTDSLIENLNNPHLPLFFMANCEFSRFDAPNHVGGSELMLLNANGGAIACISNSRPGYSSTNYAINNQFNSQLFNDENGTFLRLGDIIRITKNNSLSSTTTSHRSVNLLGDPMMRIRYPDLEMEITAVDGSPPGEVEFMLEPGAAVNFSGEVTNFSGDVQDGFNGEMSYLILDNKIPQITLGNDNFSPFEYTARMDTIATGTAMVTNGLFAFSAFMENGNTGSGNGKMLMYASNGAETATGCFTSFEVLTSTLNIAENNVLDAVFFPNPVQESLLISLSGEALPVQIEIFDGNGRVLQQMQRPSSASVEVSMKGFSSGSYFVRAMTQNGSATSRIIKVP